MLCMMTRGDETRLEPAAAMQTATLYALAPEPPREHHVCQLPLPRCVGTVSFRGYGYNLP